MRPLSDAFLDAYLAAAGPAVFESVGGYQLEKLGIHLFARIEGDHFTILGLPLLALIAFLRKAAASWSRRWWCSVSPALSAWAKSTTARFFAEAGVPVFDADAAVHRLYAGEAAAAIEAAFPGTTGEHGVDRAKLAQAVVGDPAALARLEAIIHPLVRREELRFIDEADKAGAPVAVLDIPLLFETGRRQPGRCCGGGIGPARGPARPRFRASRHDGGEVPRPACQADARRGKAPAGRFHRG